MDTVRSGDTVASTVMVAVLLLGLLSFAVATVAEKVGVTANSSCGNGYGHRYVSSIDNGSRKRYKLTSVPEVTQPKPLLVKLAGAVVLAGILRVKLTGPEVGAVPMLLTITGTVLVRPSVSTGRGLADGYGQVGGYYGWRYCCGGCIVVRVAIIDYCHGC